MDYLRHGYEIAKGEASRPGRAYRRLVNAIEGGGDLTQSDHDLVIAAREAIEQDRPLTARAALDELHLRMTADDPLRGVA